jgi:phosphatidate cytidylyltransferase
MSNLAVRLLTAAVAVPVVLAGLYLLPPVATFAMALVFTVCGSYEVLGLFGHGSRSPLRLAGSVLAVGFLAGGYFLCCGAGSALILLTATVMVTLTAGLLVRDGHELAGRKTAGLLIATLYPGVFLLLLTLMRRDAPDGPGWVVLTLKTAFFSDTGAFFAGRLLGRHKLSPRLSPSKTVEGSVGGMAAGVASGLIAHYWYLPGLELVHAVALGLAGSAVGQVGDLVESLMKRSSGTKDAGGFFPGHGGVMDRLDGAVFVTGLFWLYLHARGMV